MKESPQPLLHGDLPCPSCGYLRAGLPLERACPECGAAGFEGLVMASGTSLPPATPVVKPLTYLALGLFGCLAALIAVSFLVAPEAGRQIRTLLIPCSVPLVVESDFARGLTVGGGLYTGYVYVAGIEDSQMVTSGIATIVNPGHSAHRRNESRGVMWADVLGEFNTTDERRFETFRVKPSTPRYSDFRFYRREFEGIHRAWSDGSVDWLDGDSLDLGGAGSKDLRIQHMLGNFYY